MSAFLEAVQFVEDDALSVIWCLTEGNEPPPWENIQNAIRTLYTLALIRAYQRDG